MEGQPLSPAVVGRSRHGSDGRRCCRPRGAHAGRGIRAMAWLRPLAFAVVAFFFFLCGDVAFVAGTSAATGTSSPATTAAPSSSLPHNISLPDDDSDAVHSEAAATATARVDADGTRDAGFGHGATNMAATANSNDDDAVTTNTAAGAVATTPATASVAPAAANAAVAQAAATTMTTTTPSEEWRLRLPHPLNSKTRTLRRLFVAAGPTSTSAVSGAVSSGTAATAVEVYLLGTAHVSTDSSRDVRLLLETLDPDVVFLELCHQRAPMLVAPLPSPPPPAPTTSKTTPSNKGSWWKPWRRWGATTTTATTRRRMGRKRNNKDDAKVGNEGNGGHPSMFARATSLLTSMQQDTADSLGVEVGGEFRVAYDYWDERRRRWQGQLQKHQQQALHRENDDEYGAPPRSAAGEVDTDDDNAPTGRRRTHHHHHHRRTVHLVLGDRLFQSTLLRAWESLRWWGKVRLVAGLLVSSLIKPNPDEVKAWMESILKDDGSDLLTKSMDDLARSFPTLRDVIINERDVYMACKVYQTCRYMLQDAVAGGGDNDPRQQQQQQQQPPLRMVVIVGAGHIQGMCDWLLLVAEAGVPAEQPEETLSRLVQVRSRTLTQEELDHVMHDVVTVDPQYMEEIARQMKQEEMRQETTAEE